MERAKQSKHVLQAAGRCQLLAGLALLATIRVVGSQEIPYMPEPFVSEVTEFPFEVSQSTDQRSSRTADKAVDGDPGSYSQTNWKKPDGYWIADLLAEQPIDSIDLVNRTTTTQSARMEGLSLRILDGSSNTVASVITSDPGSGETFSFTPPTNTVGRYVWVGLENGAKNGNGDYAVNLAEVRAWSGGYNLLGPTLYTYPPATTNLASFKRSYMLRLTDDLNPASYANDGGISTEALTTTKTVDGYWEVDLGTEYALYGVRVVAAEGVGERLTNTTCRLFDENHDSIYETPVSGAVPCYDVDLDGPRFARYVRIGLEDKVHSTGPDGPREWYIGFKEVEVFGTQTNQVGIMSFSASDNAVGSGESLDLSWRLADIDYAEIFPGLGSVGPITSTNAVGSLQQTMTNSTEFVLVATNNAGIFTRGVGVEVGGNALPVVISEVVADNTYSLEDGYGNAPDWIELRNTGNSAVDLTGWGLSDKASNPMKWVFPATHIAPHSTLVVFASGEETPFDPAGYLHAGFKLDADGDDVYLTKPDGTTLVDSLEDFPELDGDLAYGRDLEGNWAFMEPTPGAVNTGKTYDGWLDELDWSHARGFCETNFTLTVTSGDPEATILYSLDGTEPSVPYTGGLPITGTSVVRVQAVWPGYKPARIQTKTFIFLDDVVASTNMNTGITQDPAYGPRVKPGLLALPTLSLVVSTTEGDIEDAIEYDEQPCSLEILWPDGQNPIQEDCGISRFGGAYSYFAKKGLSLAFRKKYGNGKLKAPLFNGFDRGTLTRTSFDRLHLRGGNHDWSRAFGMSDRFIQDSYLDMGSLNPHGRFVHVYLNGEYWGQYNCKEVLNEAFLADYLGGREEDYVSVKGNDNVSGTGWVIGAGDPPNPEPWELVRSLRDDFEAVRPYLDVGHYIDFMLLWGFGGAESEFRACGPKTAGSGFKFWINDPDGFLNDGRVGDDKSIGTVGPGYIWSGLIGEGHPDFMMLLADRIYKNFFNNGAMTRAPCTARLKARMDETRDSFLAECARWNRNYTSWENDANTCYTNYFVHQAPDMVAAWRAAGYFPSFDPPAFNQYGGAVPEGFQPVLTSSDGTIYYTLDGTDPRLPGGAVNPAALVWSAGAVTVTEDTTITIRVRTPGGEWSALAQPRYLLGSRRAPGEGDLLVTEINYNPDGPDDCEFIEIWNTGTNLVDLTGVGISNAVHFVFPEYTTLYPGAFLVVVEDAVAFSNRYQAAASPWYWPGIDVAGEWVGGLADGGETIALVASNGLALCTVDYRNDGGWPERPDGGGSSLQLVSPYLVPSGYSNQVAYLADGNHWSASLLYHGSPGRFENVNDAVVINEVLSHTDVGVDWIELYNTSGSTVDLSGFAITDKMDLPNRYVLPAGTTVDPYGYLTVSASALGFGFSELGSEAALLQVSGSNILAMIDQVEFPAVQREEPFGRHQRSDGKIVFTELAAATPGAPNAPPRVGPVVVSEIMYAPDAGFSPYVELMNASAAAVPLYDVSIPSNVWAFTGTGGFAFPEGTVLPPGGTAVLCETNPAAFRAQYGVDPAVPVFGPWAGGLDPAGEKLRLLSPGDPEPDGFVPMYRADYVTFGTNGYWPAVAGAGTSIERSPLAGYGNDPAHWRASKVFATPGFGTEYLGPFTSTISSSPEGLPLVGFPALYAQAYEIQYTDSLAEPNWRFLKGISFAPSNWVEVVDADAAAPERYYRIVHHGFAAQYYQPFAAGISGFLGGSPSIAFPALYGQPYEVQYTASLAHPDWQLLERIPHAVSDWVEVVDPSPTNSSRYYRIIWHPDALD